MSPVSIIYMLLTALIIIFIIKRKEIIVLGVVSILIIGTVFTGNPIKAVQVLSLSITSGMSEMLSIFIGISLIVTMTFALKQTGADQYISKVFRFFPTNRKAAFWVTGLFMMLVSFMIWPSPAVALLGSFLLPIAARAKLPPVYMASALSLFGYGVALSGDFFIQGVPAITAHGAGMQSSEIMPYLIPLWCVMSVTTITASFIQMKRELKFVPFTSPIVDAQPLKTDRQSKSGKIIMSIVLFLFLIDVVTMSVFQMKGDDATALISGTALVGTCVAGLIAYPAKQAAEKILHFFIEGFSFSVKVFVPAVIIIGFFLLGNSEFSSALLGKETVGCITEFVNFIVNRAHVPKAVLPVLQTIISFVYSVDGSGFAGLSVIGGIAQNYNISVEGVRLLTALGQIVIIWVAGGTLIPWSIIPVASVCGVDAAELAKKNLKPVCIGFLATVITAIVIMCIKCIE